jgi:hypothetical protein
MNRTGLASFALAATLAAGCGRTVAIDHWVPPQADIAGARTLVITDAYGRDASVAAVQDIALAAADNAPWFHDVFISARLESDGRDVWLRDSSALLAAALYVRLDVLEDNAVVVTQQDANGAIIETLSAHTLLAVTVADRDGLIIDEAELEGVHERSGPIDAWDIDESLAASATAAVNSALALVTPRPAHTNVKLDDRDARVNDLLDRHFATDDDGDARLTRDEVAAELAKLDGAPALWNRAALLESVDERAAALPLYEAAAAHEGAADWYGQELSAALDRDAAARALGL